MNAKDKQSALEAIRMMFALFDTAKNASESDNLSTEKGRASLKTFNALRDWMSLIEKEETK